MATFTRIIKAASLVMATGASAALSVGIVRQRSSLVKGRIRVNESLPHHSKWWRAAAQGQGEILYVALGDSAAQGIGASAPKNGYVGLLADRIQAITGRTVRVANLSISGATVALAVADQLPEFVRHKPDIVTVAIGANDIAHFDAEVFRTGIRHVFDALPDDAIVADLPYFFLPWNERLVAEGNRILREEAEQRGLTVVPLHATMKHEGIHGILTQFAEDLFHPNDHGYKVWASAFLPAVHELAERKFPRSATPAIADAAQQADAAEPAEQELPLSA